jgi:hypothetical protein
MRDLHDSLGGSGVTSEVQHLKIETVCSRMKGEKTEGPKCHVVTLMSRKADM